MVYEEDYVLKIKEKDDRLYIHVDPYIEEITKTDIIAYYKYVMKCKPKQVPVGEFRYADCDDCGLTDMVLHKRQTFCPKCMDMVETNADADLNIEFHKQFDVWQRRKIFIERILQGNILKFVDDINEGRIISTPDTSNVIGTEVKVDG